MKLTKQKLEQLITEELETITEGLGGIRTTPADIAVGITYQIAVGVTLLAGLVGVPEYLYNEKKDIIVDELSDMSAIEIENKLERELPDSFKETLKKQGTSVSELSIQIEQMNPDQISQVLQMKIQYEIDQEEPIQSRSYNLSDPLVAPGHYPPFKYKN